MSSNPKDTIKILKEAVLSFRVVELKECLKMLGIPVRSCRKAEMQQKILVYMERLGNMNTVMPSKFFSKIFELESRLKNKVDRRRRAVKQMETKNKREKVISVLNGKMPFFETVQVLESQKMHIEGTICFSIPWNLLSFFRKRIHKYFSYETQLLFEDCNEEWKSQGMRLRVNGLSIDTSGAQIVYITPYCCFRKQEMNRIEVEIPNSEKELKVTLSVVKRKTPDQLLQLNAVKENSKTQELLLKAFEDTGGCRVYGVSLICPFKRSVINFPCRSRFCIHPDVFDLLTFLEKVQYLLKWECPVCKIHVTFNSLELDSYFNSYMSEGKVNFTFYSRHGSGLLTSGGDRAASHKNEEIIYID